MISDVYKRQQIGKSSVSSSGTYSIKISKKKKNTKITIKIIKSGYATKSKTITVKASPSSSSGSSSSSKYVYANGGKYTSNTVSYTHLDVYKRQLMQLLAFLPLYIFYLYSYFSILQFIL